MRPQQHIPSAQRQVAIDQAEQHQTHAVTDVDADPDFPHRGFAGDARRNLLHGHLVDWEYNAVEGPPTECHLRTTRPVGEWFWQSSRLSDPEREEAQEHANTSSLVLYA